jgi:hypothetical protein
MKSNDMKHDFSKDDVGKKVLYKKDYGKDEVGIIKKVAENNVFVVYPGENEAKKEHWKKYTAEATNPDDLYLIEHRNG